MNDIKDFRFDFKYNKNEYFKTHFKCRARVMYSNDLHNKNFASSLLFVFNICGVEYSKNYKNIFFDKVKMHITDSKIYL